MKIALLGYGKMGQLIEQIAVQRGHEIVLKVGKEGVATLEDDLLKGVDLAIDFSAPAAVLNHIASCFRTNVPIVVGTTGWYGELQAVKNSCLESNNSLLYGSNFSVGVNVFFKVNNYLAKLMNNFPEYEVQLEEIHHTEKLDAPSGTAMTLAENIIENLDRKTEWINQLNDDPLESVLKPEQLLIESARVAHVPGTHTILYSSEIDEIEIKHTANNRAGFALGAVIAAEWLQNKQGFYSVADVFNFE